METVRLYLKIVDRISAALWPALVQLISGAYDELLHQGLNGAWWQLGLGGFL